MGQRRERERSAFAAVVRAKHEADIFAGHHDHQRPEDQRDGAHHRYRHGHRAARRQHRLADRVERARADVAVDDAERAQRQPEISSPPGAEPVADMLTPLGVG